MSKGGVTNGKRVMRQIWSTALASFLLIGFAAVVSAAAIAAAGDADRHAEQRAMGRAMMIEAQYRLALDVRR